MNYNYGFLMDKDVLIKQLNVEVALADATLYPASGSFIDVTDFDRFAFLVQAGALDSATTLQVRQDTGATATAGIKDVTGATTVIGATGDNKWYLIEVDTSKLDSNNGYHYVSLLVTGPATVNDFAAITFFGFGKGSRPVTQGADRGAAVFVGG